MEDFKTSLLREKFTLMPLVEGDKPLIACSNRIVIPLHSADGIDNETFIIRTQNMHSCTRLAAALIKEFYERGSLLSRATPLSWETLWDDVIKGYEKLWNPNIWGVIYHKGRIIYQYAKHHPFLDIIEKCDAANKGNYTQAVRFAEESFSQAGKDVKITLDSNIALVSSTTEAEAKCGLILRAATGTTTFNFTAHPKEEAQPKALHPYTILTVSAALMEIVQLSFEVGMLNRKKQFDLYEPHSDEERKHKRAETRLTNLNRAIDQFENNFSVMYRPDRPYIKDMIAKAEKVAGKILKGEIEDKIASGSLDADDWVL